MPDIHEMKLSQLLDILPWEDPFDREALLFASMSQFGWILPLVIDTAGVVLLGRERLCCARAIGQTTVPCVFREFLTEEQVDAFRAAEHRLLELLPWEEGSAGEVGAILRRAGLEPDALCRGGGDPPGAGLSFYAGR